jgi:hypothetical protein
MLHGVSVLYDFTDLFKLDHFRDAHADTEDPLTVCDSD